MFSQKKITKIVKEAAKKFNIPVPVAEEIFRSQFSCAREAIETKKNIRFPYIGLLYNRDNKNPEYLEHKK